MSIATARELQPTARARHWSDALALPLFASAILAAAALVFLVEPMVAKMILPAFGGSPAVWITAIVFFQGVLLLGYAYAHVSTRLLGARAQPLVQLGLLAAVLVALPVGQHISSPPAGLSPSLWLLGILALAVGAPFFAVASASPVLQRWFASTNHSAARDPYFLYVASNIGSLLGLVAYPLVVEPNLSLSAQARLWSVGYLMFVALSLVCGALLLRRGGRAENLEPARVVLAARISWRTRLRWLLFALLPVSLMLGATSFISTDVASAPLLWVLPLAVYLGTFIVAFARKPLISVYTAARVLPFSVVLLLPSLLNLVAIPVPLVIVLHLSVLFFAGIVAHGRLASERPPTERLTEFYLLLSLGGVLGGAFNAFLAPQLFESVAEYPLAIIGALLLTPLARRARNAPRSHRARLLRIAVQVQAFVLVAVVAVRALADTGVTSGALLAATAVLGLLLVAVRRTVPSLLIAALLALVIVGSGTGVIHAERTFFGVHRVIETEEGDHLLIHGTTLHGREGFAAGRRAPTSYYARTGPVGDAFRALQRAESFSQVHVIGLGIGALAGYGRPGQAFTFYEIDPAVARIARDPRLFTYLDRSQADVTIVLGDGRLELAETAGRSSDLVVIDAFSSDAIPLHLLTREAVGLYFAKLRANGVALFNISNRHLALEPVLAAISRDLGLAGAARLDERISARELEVGKQGSHWVALARNPARLKPLVDAGWQPLRSSDGVRAWTDDYSNILGVVRWRGR